MEIEEEGEKQSELPSLSSGLSKEEIQKLRDLTSTYNDESESILSIQRELIQLLENRKSMDFLQQSLEEERKRNVLLE